MEWWQTLVIALGTYGFTKTMDALLSFLQDKREFKKARRDKALQELEDLKDAIGGYYELAANWKPHEMKANKYRDMMTEDDHLIGKYNKYPGIASAARDAIHWCKIVAHAENEHTIDVVESKKTLAQKYRSFIEACDAHLDSMV